MTGYSHAVTEECSKCGRTFTCKGTGWAKSKETERCPFEYSSCYCERCHHGKTRSEGCEEINHQEVVEFT